MQIVHSGVRPGCFLMCADHQGTVQREGRPWPAAGQLGKAGPAGPGWQPASGREAGPDRWAGLETLPMQEFHAPDL